MISIEVLNASLPHTSYFQPGKVLEGGGIDTMCVVKSRSGDLIGRTHVASHTFDPAWHESNKFSIAWRGSCLDAQEVNHRRPFYFEHIEVEVHEISRRDPEKSVKLYETRVPLNHMEQFRSYRLLSAKGSIKADTKEPQSGANGANGRGLDGMEGSEIDLLENCRIFVRVSCIDHQLMTELPCGLGQRQVREMIPLHDLRYRHLFLSSEWHPNAFTYHYGLAGPTHGELMIDRFERIEWVTPCGNNMFGDRFQVTCYGTLFVTDLRLIFIPRELVFPFETDPIILDEYSLGRANSPAMTLLHHYTVQIPLSSVRDSKLIHPIFMNDHMRATLVVETLDSTHYYFVAHSSASNLAYKPPTIAERLETLSYIKDDVKRVLEDCDYLCGLDTYGVDPHVWVLRVVDYIQAELRFDTVWIRWTRYMKKSMIALMEEMNPNNGKAHVDSLRLGNRAVLDISRDFQRMQIQFTRWDFSEINASYRLCRTYPRSLVFPSSLTDDDLQGAASQRSSQRLPAMVWLHPVNRAALCRASQPMAGMSGMSTLDFDKKLLLAIKSNCPLNLPLRITDARPKLNANANAMQGKGFENISQIGGPSVASLVFMDIDNIHVMRHSFVKVKEGFMSQWTPVNHGFSVPSGSPSLASADLGDLMMNTMSHTTSALTTNGASVGDSMSNYFANSKWPYHIASLLRGAINVADSLMIGHPVLVHCSDGWDRTAQLTSMAQILIDPHYRTINGLLGLIQKDWCSFGHKFEDRTGVGFHCHPREASPIFLQFLDALYQVINQFPTAFEYNARFLELLVQIQLSGWFFTFRANSEHDRLMMIKRILAYESMELGDFEFGSASAYILSLLRVSPYFRNLYRNDTYTPKSTEANTEVHYLRPKHAVVDIDCWRDGLFGLNSNMLHLQELVAQYRVREAEARAVVSDFTQRYVTQVENYAGSWNNVMKQKLNTLYNICYPNRPIMLDSRISRDSLAQTFKNFLGKSKSKEATSLTLPSSRQSYRLASTSDIEVRLAVASRRVATLIYANWLAKKSAKEFNTSSVRALRALRLLARSTVHNHLTARASELETTSLMVRGILYDIIGEAAGRGCRSQLWRTPTGDVIFSSRSLEYLSAQTYGDILTGSMTSPMQTKHTSLSSRFFKSLKTRPDMIDEYSGVYSLEDDVPTESTTKSSSSSSISGMFRSLLK